MSSRNARKGRTLGQTARFLRRSVAVEYNQSVVMAMGHFTACGNALKIKRSKLYFGTDQIPGPRLRVWAGVES